MSTDNPISPTIEKSKPTQQKRKGLWLLVTGSLLVGGGWYAYTQMNRTSSNAAIPVSIMPAMQGNVENSVTESGTIELGGQQVLKAPSEVTVERVNVKEGQRVRKGQALVMLRNRQAQDQLKDQLAENAKAELDLSQTRAKVADAAQKLQQAKDDPDLARSREKVAEVQVQVKAAETRFKESQALLQKGFISATELQTDKTALDTAKSSLRDAEIAAFKAQREHQNKVATAQSALDDAQITLDKAEIDIQKGREKIEGLQRQLSDRVVTSSIDGIVLKVNVRNGDGIKTESPILSLGDPTQETIRIQLTTLNAAKVQVRQPARVSLIGPQMQQFTGRVVSLSPQATVPGAQLGDAASVQPGQQAKVEARIALDKPSNTLIPGSSVSVEVITEQRQNVIFVAPEAVQRTEEPPFVWLKDKNNRAKKQAIQIGLQGLQGIEVTQGLNAGDEVVIPQPNNQIQAGSLLNTDPQPVPSPSP
ncbi:efflux RND transporter periplasmic adaptor subunit [Leptolyngbya sp. AN03gr2]|uniref:efflux RND transporter periplasmic adaptor subunit n=1 Tax=unclassified Leptolyngbya TaxID=2650499 RepID=UPI003D321E93